MADIVAAALSSHAYTFQEPETWDARRARTLENYRRRFGVDRAPAAEISTATLADDAVRYETIRATMADIRDTLRALRVETIVVIGDDQNENFREGNLPQFAVFTGDTLKLADSHKQSRCEVRCDSELAQAILRAAVEGGVDLASSSHFAGNVLLSHAHVEPMSYLGNEFALIPFFVNAINVPAPTPRRCYKVGQVLRRAIESAPQRRVALYASGGMSHFSAGFPWHRYNGRATIGSIAVDFDQRSMRAIREGRGHVLAGLSSEDLLNNGDVEMRQTIVLLGAIADQKPDVLVYEPFHRAITGMAVGLWRSLI
jgi:protocatechuate 4,5-dioxygenase, beta chain